MSLERTDQGKVNRYLFTDKVVIWVEGVDDLPFYRIGLADTGCEFVPAGGGNECDKLVEALIEENLPFIVILDGDYDIIWGVSSTHSRVVKLERYALENYLLEKEIIVVICRNYISLKLGGRLEQVGDLDDICDSVEEEFYSIVDHIEENLLQVVLLDIMNLKEGTGRAVLPDKIDRFLIGGRGFDFSFDEINKNLLKYSDGISKETINEVVSAVINYVIVRKFTDIIPGHLLFGLIRRFIIGEVCKASGRNVNIDNDGLLLLLSQYVWVEAQDDDHSNLKRRIESAITEVRAMR